MRRYALLAGGLLLAVGAHAGGAALQVRHAWIRWLPGDLPAAAYAVVVNAGDKPVRLIGADSPDYVAVMLHRSFQRNGVEHMRKVDGIDVPAHARVALAPGGYHLMLMHARHPIAPGDHVRLNLHFASGSTLGIDVPVRPATARGG